VFLCPIDAEVRLAGSKSNNCSGRVEIFHSSTWGTVCDDHWDLDDAQVVWRELGCGPALSAPREAHYGQGTGPIWLDAVGCSGSERSVTECAHRGFGNHICQHSEDAGVVCSGERILVIIFSKSASFQLAPKYHGCQNYSFLCTFHQIIFKTFYLKDQKLHKMMLSNQMVFSISIPEKLF